MEEDQFLWWMNFCEPTASQEAELANCPFAREFEDFVESSPMAIPIPISSSPSPSPSPSPSSSLGSPIRVVSLPESPTSPDQCMAEEDAVFHTPPEHHPNPNDLCAEEVGAAEAKRGRVVVGEEFDGEIEVVETEGGEGVGRTKVYSEDELVAISMFAEWYADNMATAAARREIEGSMNNGVSELDAISGNHDLGGEIENLESIGGEKPSDSSGSLGSCEILGSKTCETELDGVEKGVEIAKSAEEIAKDGNCEIVGDESCEVVEIAKDGHRSGVVGSNGKSVEEIDGRKRKLPPWFNGKQRNAGESLEEQSGSPPLMKEKGKDAGESSEEQSGSPPLTKEKGKDVGESCEGPEFLALLNEYFKKKDEEGGDPLDTAKERGLKYVKPRFLE